MKRILLLTYCLAAFITTKSQNISYTCPKDTVLGCNTTCFTLTAQFPDIHSLGDTYTFQNLTTASACRPYASPDLPGNPIVINIDDKYSATPISLNFNFPFFGTLYNQLLVSTNGTITFDVSLADGFSDYGILNSNGFLSATTGTPEDLPSTLFDGALIMGPFHDINPAANTSPTRQIKYDIIGTAPNRKFVFSFYKVPLFNCTASFENTHQIILFESTGIVEVDIIDKEICTTWNEGRAMVGMQDITKTKSIMAPGRKASDAPWGSIGMNEVWRFIPSAGATLYRKVELLNSAGVVVATGDTTRVDANTFATSFANVCPPSGTSVYVVKTSYVKIDDPTVTIFSLDTVNVTRQPTLPLTATTTPSTCGLSTGTITVSVGAGGVAPYQYSINGGALQASNVFTGLAAGTYTVFAQDAGGCNNTISVTVSNIGTLPSTNTTTGTSCPGLNNGTVTVTPTAGTAPYTYVLDGGTSQASNAYTGLVSGPHIIVFTDANLCTGTVNFAITAGTAITSTSSTTSTTCPGVNNGAVTITPTSGTAPYTYSIDGGAFQASNTFTGLTPGAHTINIRDAIGCTGIRNITIFTGSSITSTTALTQATCSVASNGSATINPSSGTAPYTYSIDGGASQASNIFTGLTPGSHTVTIKDVNNCSGTKTFTITTGAGVSGSVTTASTSCPGVNNGTITATGSNGTAPYTYSLDGGAFQVSNVFTGVSAASHTVTFKDASGCTGTAPATVAAGTAIAGSATSTGASCPSVNNGTITATPTSGTAPYTYSLDAGAFQASATFTGVAAGSHTVTYKDANGCTGTATVTVTAGPAITGTSTSTGTSCPSVNDGTVTVTPTTGTAPYTYSIDGGASQPGNIFTGLAAGSHTATFTDATGCSGTTTVSVSTGAALTGTSTSTGTSCPAVNNGTVTVTPTTGTAPYTYSIDGGASQPGNIFTGLAAGSHTATFTDAIGCSGTTTVTVATGAVITGTATSTGTSCPTVSNGTVTVGAITGTAPYQYSIDGGALQASNIFTGLASGAHIVGFTDAVGCSGTTTVTVATGAVITGSGTSTGTSCPTVSDGTITVTPATGTAPYSYSIDGLPSQASNIFTNVAAGTHIMTFTDVLGCTGTTQVTVNQGVSLIASTITTGTSCPTVNNGTMNVIPSTGIAPYSYSIDGGPAQPGALFSNLAPGPHTVTFTDVQGCSGTVTGTVAMGASLTSTISAVNPVCANINDGSITVTPTSGVAPYQYSLNGGAPQPSATFSNLAPGAYTITFTDAIGCSGTNTRVLTSNPAINLTFTRTVPVCNGDANGTINIVASGGVAPYQYALSPFATYQSSGTFTGLTANTYIFEVKDNVGCTKQITVVLTEPLLLTASATSTSGSCNGNDGTITITAAGGTPAYQYSVDNGVTYQATNNFVVSGGNYPDIRVKDSKGCIANAATNVILIDTMYINLGPDSVICEGQSVRFEPRTNPQTNIFKWRTIPDPIRVNTLDYDSIKNATATPSDTTTYILNAKWGVCPAREDTITVLVKRRPIPDAGPTAYVCHDNKVTTLNGSASNLSGTVNYEWTDTTHLETPHTNITVARPDTTEDFILTVTDNYGCNFIEKDTVRVYVQPPVPAFAGNDTIAIRGTPHQMLASGGVNYEWTPSTPLNLSTIANPLATLFNDQRFVVKVTDIGGCIGYDSVYVQIYDGPAYYVPNTFSPNGDGINDVFRAIPVGISYTEWFRVFNRFGELVFETNKWLKGWDGTYLGKKQSPGVYVWIVKGMDKNGRKVEMKGTVMIIQ